MTMNFTAPSHMYAASKPWKLHCHSSLTVKSCCMHAMAAAAKACMALQAGSCV